MSALVTITLDSDQLLDTPTEAIMVEKVADYPSACLAIRVALHSRKASAIGVRNRTVATWLTAYAQTYGEAVVVIRKYTARTALAERWQIEVPTTVSDAEIMEARLLECAPVARAGQSFADLILTHYYGDLPAYAALPVAHLGDLLNRYDPAKWKAASSRPLVFRLLKERFQQWHDRAHNDAVRTIIAALRDDAEGLRRDLCQYKVLRNYPPELGSKVLGSRWEAFRKAKVDTDMLDVTYGGVEAANEIGYYRTSLRDQIGGTADIEALLGQVSGCLDSEFQFIAELLHDHPEWITSELLGRIRRRFASIQLRVGQSLATLRKLIKPAFPAAPQEEWDAERRLAWVQDSYMPYYAWLEAQNRQDDTVAEYACAFADWFYTNFVALKNGQPDRFAFTALYDERHLMKAKDAVTLALIVDNFNFVHFEELCRLFQAQGMSLAGSEPRFSLIPTATEVGKAALIATTGDQIDLPTTENFYVHGGLTPEEVVVPFAWFTFVPVVPDAPTVSLLSTQFRYAVKSRIPIEIGNPNAFPLEGITIRLLDADADEILLDRLAAKHKTTVELTTVFRKAIGGASTRPLTVRVKYSYQGTDYTASDTEFTIMLKALMEEKDNVDDLF